MSLIAGKVRGENRLPEASFCTTNYIGWHIGPSLPRLPFYFHYFAKLLDRGPHFENHCSREIPKEKVNINNNYYHLSSTYYMSGTVVSSIYIFIYNSIYHSNRILYGMTLREVTCYFYNATVILYMLGLVLQLERAHFENLDNVFFHFLKIYFYVFI